MAAPTNSPADILAVCQANYAAHTGDCSGFVRACAAALSISLQGQANQIVQTIQAGNGWTVIDGPTGAAQAALGNFVVGGMIEPGHGHVVVVVPGPLNRGVNPSAVWGSLGYLPSGSTAGANGIVNTVNYSFTAANLPNVVYAVYSTANLPPPKPNQAQTLPPPAQMAPAPAEKNYPLNNGVRAVYPHPTATQASYTVPAQFVVVERPSSSQGAGNGIGHIGDHCTHGAVIITGSASTGANSLPVARLGDLVNCPIHGVNPFVSNCSPTVLFEGKPVTTNGSVTQCGAILILGSNNVAAIL
jgi:uncharacterized Zn-binding protein involved in type VI secretion